MNQPVLSTFSPRWGWRALLPCSILCSLLIGGCVHRPTLVPANEQLPLDRRMVVYPAGTSLVPFMVGLTGPTAFCTDVNGNRFIAEGGIDGREPRIFGIHPDNTRFDIYPTGRRIPFDIVPTGFHLYGPIGGMVAHQGKLFVSHRDASDRGMITAFAYDRKDPGHTTIVGDLPAEGDYGMTDLAVSPATGRIYFGVGAATNSGVVGLDNTWTKRHPDFHDIPLSDIVLLGLRFDVPNPGAGLFAPTILVTGCCQALGVSNENRIPGQSTPTGAIYSIDPEGGAPRAEAHGVRNPVGLGFYEYRLYFTDQGMEMRGTRPVKDDPCVLFKFAQGTWYGGFDYTRDLNPISDHRYQPPFELIIKSGYRELSALVNQIASGLLTPNRDALLDAVFPPLSGASKFAFVPASGPFSKYNGSTIVALWGDRAPFATSGYKMTGPTGYKLVIVNEHGQVSDFIRNADDGPVSRLKQSDGLERPIDVKFGPDGALYIVDFGQVEIKGSRVQVIPGTGKIYKLVGKAEPPAK